MSDNTPYKPTEAEQRLSNDVRAKAKAKPRPKMGTTYSQDPDGPLRAKIELDHPDAQGVGADTFYASIGTHDWDFARMLIAQVASFSLSDADEKASRDDKSLRAHMALVQGVEPQGEVEAMLAVQMAAVHTATIRMAQLLKNATDLDRMERFERSMNRLGRTFTTQVEALKKYRSGAQTVVVEHRHYHLHQEADGEATGVGDGVSVEMEQQSHVRSIPERQAVRGNFEAHRPAMPGAGGERQERVPFPRSSSGRTKRAA